MTIEAVFYGDTEATAREQYARWAAKEKAEVELLSLTPDEERGWIWHAVVEVRTVEQMEMAL